MCPLLRELDRGWLGLCFCRMGLACASSLFPYFDRKEGPLQFRGLPVGKVTSQLAQPRLFIWNWLGKNVTVNEREFHIETLVWGREGRACPETAEHWVGCCPCYWQRFCFGAWVESLEIRGIVSSCCSFGIMFWSTLCYRRLALQGWRKVEGAQSRLTRGRSREQLSSTPGKQQCVSKWEKNCDPSFTGVLLGVVSVSC